MKLKLYLLGFSRHLEHSTIIYEDPQHSPLLRLSWNKQDPNYLATFSLDALEVCHFPCVIKCNHTWTHRPFPSCLSPSLHAKPLVQKCVLATGSLETVETNVLYMYMYMWKVLHENFLETKTQGNLKMDHL